MSGGGGGGTVAEIPTNQQRGTQAVFDATAKYSPDENVISGVSTVASTFNTNWEEVLDRSLYEIAGV